MRIRILYLLFFILIFCNCNGQQVEKTEAGNTKEHTFQMVSVPSVITLTVFTTDYYSIFYR